MGYEWQMRTEHLDDTDEIVEALQADWEPFAVTEMRVYFKRHVFGELAEPKSSTKPENVNWAGNELDVREEDDDAKGRS